MVRFVENEVRAMGRSSSGVKGMDLDGAHIVGAEMINSGEQILIVTEKGYGKKTFIDEYRLTHRGSKGVKALNVTEKNGSMASLKRVDEGKELELIIVTDSGVIIKLPMDQVSTLKRATQGVRLINLKDDHTVATISLVDKEKEEEQIEDSVENPEVINNDNSDIVELAESEIAAADENEISEVIEEAAEENLEN
jgi:DNA gyrase subunit A